MKRIFIAIPLEVGPVFLEAFNDLKDQLSNEPIKWVEDYNLHLTLKFLGDTEEKKIDEIKTKLIECCKEFKPFEFSLKGFGYFGSKRQPAVIYAGIENQETLGQMSLLIEKIATETGFEPEARPFKAHLTLGRINF